METSNIQRLIDLSGVGSVDATISLCDYYIQNNDFQKAFDCVYRLKKTNDANILRKLGYLYENGIGTNKNIENAKECFLAAFNNGDVNSGFDLALIHYKNKEYAECVEYLRSGASNKHIQSLKMLAEFYLKGIAVVKDINISLNLYLKILEFGDSGVLFNIGKIYFDLKQYKDAYKYLYDSFFIKDFRSSVYLANCYLIGEGCEKSIKTAIDILEKGAKNNDYQSCTNLAKIYADGIIVKIDETKSKFYTEKANSIKINKK